MSVFGQKETVIFVGGRGTKAGDANAGGGCTKAYWGDLYNPNKVLSDVMGTNGEPSSDALAWNGSQTACTVVDNGSGKVRIQRSGVFYNCEVGHIANIDFASLITDGRYEVTAVDTGTGDWIDIGELTYAGTTCDVKVGGAFPTQQEALDETDAGNYSVNILTNKVPDLFAAIDVDVGGGDVYQYNTWKRIIGIDSVDGVELLAGTYIEVSDNANDINCYAIGNVNNTEFRHIYTYSEVGSSTKAGWSDTGTAIRWGISLVDCKSEGHRYAIEMLTKKWYLQVLGGEYKSALRVFHLNNIGGAKIQGAFLESTSSSALIQFYNTAGGVVIDRCVLKKAGEGSGIDIMGFGLFMITNNVFYDVDDGITLNYGNTELIEYNNIYYLYDQVNSLAINWVSGSILYSDYSCLWTAGGAPQHADRWGGGSKPKHAIEENPLFVDAGSGDFRPRNPNVLRGGLPDIDGNPSQMGVILQKYQFARRARGANVGRLQIIR